MAFLTAAMRDKGQKPGCLGIRKVLKQRIPQDQLENLNKQTYVQDLGYFFHFGYSRSSGLMERTGRVPVSINGTHIHISRRIIPKPTSPTSPASSSSSSPTATATDPDAGFPGSVQQVGRHMTDASVLVDKYMRLLKKSANKQWDGLRKNAELTRKFCVATSKDLPRKLYKSTVRLSVSVDKTGRSLYSKAAAIWRDL